MLSGPDRRGRRNTWRTCSSPSWSTPASSIPTGTWRPSSWSDTKTSLVQAAVIREVTQGISFDALGTLDSLHS